MGFPNTNVLEPHEDSTKQRITCTKNSPCFDPRSISPLPIDLKIAYSAEDRKSIGTVFYLYTTRHPHVKEILNVDNSTTIWKSSFNPELPTKIIVHGYMNGVFLSTWMRRMKDELLSEGHYNVILVDWSRGSSFTKRDQAIANSRVVGTEVVILIKGLQRYKCSVVFYDVQVIKGARLEKFHIIGHSLGSHVAGYAGKHIKGIGRITGLDPHIRNVPSEIQLNVHDAVFVDIIHTDTERLMFVIRDYNTVPVMGDVDFYVNGGDYNPACQSLASRKQLARNLFDALLYTAACDHMISTEYFIASIRHPNCFVSVPCFDYFEFLSGKCTCNASNPCSVMGLHADKYTYRTPFKGINRNFYLQTGSKYPFCRRK
ncbi:pancreatic lipase-related protein 3-like [Centruroides sculpturatus]|uniref:pancreatic lipase-related protein 3-like n=1 Tax=Centruroides sculpturatus TaxID=218467 RepID=UPI000C6E44C4|nr:pancreatic lipase-related protein 3-like [Centruroides sculpturatus]